MEVMHVRFCCDSVFTQRIMWDAFENDSVGGEKESSLCWQDVWASQETSSSFLPAIRVQKHPQPLWHQLLSRKQCWTKNLRLMGKEHENNNTSDSGTEEYAQAVCVCEHVWASQEGFQKWENICATESGSPSIIVRQNHCTTGFDGKNFSTACRPVQR